MNYIVYICNTKYFKIEVTMVNIEDFIKRLEKLLEYYSLTASSFADKIGVQRSSMSHLLSGRNKPSLDFILKILEVFPEVDLYWILNGKGNFPKSNHSEVPQETIVQKENNTADLFTLNKETPEFQGKSNNFEPEISKDGKVEKIVIFYSNGTFKEYKPE